ncbi:MAG: chromosomal replication initiator DnaA, partial [Rhodobacteraceae bacterium]|nr:chromosomal replication initiator DnaA [Paracoccaceae bacterium]
MTTAEQLVLPLPVRAAQGRDDFFIAPCNALAVQQLDNWPNWQNGKLALVGPMGAGKTHLAHVWAAQTGAKIIDAAELADGALGDGAVVVEGADDISGNPVAQENLFHL